MADFLLSSFDCFEELCSCFNVVISPSFKEGGETCFISYAGFVT